MMLAWLLLLAAGAASAHGSSQNIRVPAAGPAPEFALSDQDGSPLALTSLRGKVVVVTFIYTSCNQDCPLVTERMASLRAPLGADFDSRVHFVSISVDPQFDTPAVLREYAKAHGVNAPGWSFLTGSPPVVEEVERAYGARGKPHGRSGRVEHLFVTSLIDRQGNLRVRYLGAGFKPKELLQDIQALLGE